ncbi:MAG: hypothetical protein WC655_24715 [Candidatus Hydrogenedentales bacterium]
MNQSNDNLLFGSQEFVDTWRTVFKLQKLFDLAKLGLSAEKMLEELCQRLCMELRVHEARLCLSGEETYDVSFGIPPGTQKMPFCIESFFANQQILVPIMVGSCAIGCVEVGRPDKRNFELKDKILVDLVASQLGLIAACAMPLRSNDEKDISQLAILSMFESAMKVVEEAKGDLQKAADSLVSVTRCGIPCDCAVLARWNKLGTEELSSSGDVRAVRLMKNAIMKNREDAFSNAGFVRRPNKSRKCGGILMYPMANLKNYRGLIALGRNSDGDEFTTIEKSALRVLSALISE